jgi:hypothetical protein
VTQLVGEIPGSVPKKVARLLGRTSHALDRADHVAERTSTAKKPKLTAACATAIQGATQDVRDTLGL